MGDAPTPAPASIQIQGIDGKTYEPLMVAPHRAAVLVFVLQDCPICNGYAPQIERLAAESLAKDVPFYLIHVDPAFTPDDARKHARDYGYTIPVLIDRRHELVRRLGVRAVPTAVVLNSQGQTEYEGRIDDQYVALGKARNVVTSHDLHDALAAVLAGKPVAHPRTHAIGCAVPDLPAAAEAIAPPPPVHVAPKLPEIPARTFKLADFGGVGDGKTMNTDTFRRAIDAASKAGGGHLIVPAGTYLTMPIVLTSHLDLHLDKDATILFPNALAAYGFPDLDHATQAQADAMERSLHPLIGGSHLTDVAITGEGTINGSGDAWWAWTKKPAAAHPGRVVIPRVRLVQFDRCRRVHVQGVTLTRSPQFHLMPDKCEDVLIEDVKILAPGDAPNTDAIDPYSCKNLLIRRCLLDVGDDNVAFKTSDGPIENALVTDCTCKHGHGISFGSQLHGGAHDILVTRCTFEGTHPAIRIKSSRTRGGGTVENITYSDITMKDVGTAITINLYYFDKPGMAARKAEPVTPTTPMVRNILIRNVTVDGAKEAGDLVGLPERPLENILLDYVTITAEKGMVIQDAKNVHFDDVKITPKSGPPFTATAAQVIESGNH